MKFSEATYLVNKNAGYFPYFQLVLRTRVSKKKAVNVVVTGEAGEGKSYKAFTLCRLVDPKFTVDQIVFTYGGYMRLINRLRMGAAIMFDEPSYAMGKREWYKQVNKVLVQTIESQRFKIHPLFIPIINKVLLDKTVRDHLIQYQVIVTDRGVADVFRIQASQFEEKTYYHFLCKLRYPLVDKCPSTFFQGRNRDSCLGCRYLKRDCPTFRAQYERKKAEVQNKRYQRGEEDAELLESRAMTDKEIEDKLYALQQKFTDEDGKIDINLMRLVAKEELHIVIGHNRCYRMKTALKYHHPDEFQ